MRWKSLSILIAFVVITISANFALAVYPSADLTGDGLSHLAYLTSILSQLF